MSGFFQLARCMWLFHAVACVGVFSLYKQIKFHFMELLHFKFISGWLFGSFLPLCTGRYEQCQYGHSCAGFCVDMRFHFSWVRTRKRNRSGTQNCSVTWPFYVDNEELCKRRCIAAPFPTLTSSECRL